MRKYHFEALILRGRSAAYGFIKSTAGMSVRFPYCNAIILYTRQRRECTHPRSQFSRGGARTQTFDVCEGSGSAFAAFGCPARRAGPGEY